MTDLRKAAEQALEALLSYEQYIHPLTNFFGGPEVPREGSTSAKVEDAITALREALAQPEQEPVERECKSGGLNVYWYATHGMIQVTFE
jgi:hypothetical protein